MTFLNAPNLLWNVELCFSSSLTETKHCFVLPHACGGCQTVFLNGGSGPESFRGQHAATLKKPSPPLGGLRESWEVVVFLWVGVGVWLWIRFQTHVRRMSTCIYLGAGGVSCFYKCRFRGQWQLVCVCTSFKLSVLIRILTPELVYYPNLLCQTFM